MTALAAIAVAFGDGFLDWQHEGNKWVWLMAGTTCSKDFDSKLGVTRLASEHGTNQPATYHAHRVPYKLLLNYSPFSDISTS